MWWPAFAVRTAVEEPLALERLPVHPPEVPEILKTPEILRDFRLETLRRFPALEKIPYVITPFNE